MISRNVGYEGKEIGSTIVYLFEVMVFYPRGQCRAGNVLKTEIKELEMRMLAFS